ncbi:hypothetical protein AA0117_g6003 [Alternaria alternata]|uniref:Uncharacterized protein n=2 Tax=Alternaria alternata complex TaxID=187734 RepID=A0A4Q4NG41_ALTAL|nr:hypothetical protein AA0114_g6066 [Alternaria tenuissima]RYN76018.1 hypothetical protein AA0117_g6003 [Alternaria alternata]
MALRTCFIFALRLAAVYLCGSTSTLERSGAQIQQIV